MQRETVAYLVEPVPGVRGIYDAPAETRRQVFASIRSVGMRESYEALAHGLRPEIVLILKHDFEYQHEPLCDLEGTVPGQYDRYRILRTYITEADGIELVLQREKERG